MIKTFADRETAAAFAGERVRRFGADWLPAARRKLAQLHRVERVEELRIPAGNRLERLIGDREGQWSIRINGQWRVCFVWREGHAWDVEIADYH
jgi:proteic killer suppression protein